MQTYVDDKVGKAVEIRRSEIQLRLRALCQLSRVNSRLANVITLHKQSLALLTGSGQSLDELNVQIIIQAHDDVWPPKLRPPSGGVYWTYLENPAA